MSNALEKKSFLNPEQSELGQTSRYDATYNPERLFAIPRAVKREEIGIDPQHLPFYGVDCWNHYEVSWLNPKGKPMVAIAEILYDCTTPYLIESKSLKLYFNSFNQTKFNNKEDLRITIERDLTQRLEGTVQVSLYSLDEPKFLTIQAAPAGICLDDLDVSCTDYIVRPDFLTVQEKQLTEVLYSNLLKSNCLVTNQPDWGTIQITYSGKQIHQAGLLQYLVSFRNHNEFHEQCIERIFVDIMHYCKPEKLTVCGRYTRRGGLDINPLRSSESTWTQDLNQRLVRQ